MSCVSPTTSNGPQNVAEANSSGDYLKTQMEKMDAGWDELEKMSQNRAKFLNAELGELRFNADCALVEQTLANQEVKLQSVQLSDDPATAEQALLEHKQLQSTINDISGRVDTITNAADESKSENIKSRGDKLNDRYAKIKKLADETAARLDENAQGTEFVSVVE
jgi:hypothetical protein